MANDSNISQFFNAPDSGASSYANEVASYYAKQAVNPTPTTGIDPSAIDPRKVYLARAMRTVDGLNDAERDFVLNSVEANAEKYGDIAYGIENNISKAANSDYAKSNQDRTALQAAGDIATGLSLGTLDFGLQAGQFLTNLSPLGIADRAFGTHLTEPLNKMWASARGANQQLMHSLYSDVKNHGEEIKEYKNQLDEARHLREQEEAIANGESPITAITSRIGKDAYSAIGNALSTPTALLDMPVELLESILSMKALGKIGLGVAKGATALTNALVDRTAARAGVAAAERAGVAGRSAVAEGSPEFMGPPRPLRASAEQSPDFVGPRIMAEQRADFVGPKPLAEQRADFMGPRRPPISEANVVGNTATRTAAQAAEGTAADAVANESEGWLAKVGKGFWNKKTEMAHVGIQEGGAGASTAYDTVQRMSTDELEQSSELYRDKKKKYLAQGLSEEEASSRAKEEVAQAAAFDSGVLQAMIAAPAGKLMPDNMIKSPFKTFFSGRNYLNNVTKETGEEMLEGLGQFGYNVGAKNTYNNDQDLAKDMGRSIGEGGIAALVGTGEMGAPRAALRGIGKGIGKVLDAKDEHDYNKIKEQLANNKDTISSAAAMIRQNKNNSVDPSVAAVSGSIVNTEHAERSLNKFVDATTPLTKEQRDQLNKEYGIEDSIEEGDTKLSVFEAVANELNDTLDAHDSLDDGARLVALRKAKMFTKLRNELFGNTSLEETLNQISDEDTRNKVRTAFEAYQKLGSNKRFAKVEAKVNAYANEIAKGSDSVLNIINDTSLSEEQRAAKLKPIIEANRFLLSDGLASNEELAKAKKLAETVANNTKDKGDSIGIASFLDEINTAEQNNARNEELIQQDNKINKAAAKEINDPTISADDVAAYRAGDNLDKVKYQKIDALLGGSEAKQSYSSVLRDVKALRRRNPDLARQKMYKYMNFVQSQINKLNAYKQSHDEYLANKKANPNQKVFAQAKPYTTYNPKDKGSWYDSPTGIYAGEPRLGHMMALEAEQLKAQFDHLNNTYFNGEYSLSGYDQNTVDEISDYYTDWLSKQRKDGNSTNNSEYYDPRYDPKASQENAQREVPPADNVAPSQNQNNTTQQKPSETQNQKPQENVSQDIDFSGYGNTNNTTNNSNTNQNQTQQKSNETEAKPQENNSAPTEDLMDSFLREEAKNEHTEENNTNNQAPNQTQEQNQKPADNTNVNNNSNTSPKSKRDYLNIGNDSLTDFLARLYNGTVHPFLKSIGDALSNNNFTESASAIVKKVHQCISDYNASHPNSVVPVKYEQILVKAVKHYFNEKNKQKIKDSKENQTNASQQNNSNPQNTEDTSPNINNNTNTDNKTTSQNTQDTNTQDNTNNSDTFTRNQAETFVNQLKVDLSSGSKWNDKLENFFRKNEKELIDFFAKWDPYTRHPAELDMFMDEFNDKAKPKLNKEDLATFKEAVRDLSQQEKPKTEAPTQEQSELNQLTPNEELKSWDEQTTETNPKEEPKPIDQQSSNKEMAPAPGSELSPLERYWNSAFTDIDEGVHYEYPYLKSRIIAALKNAPANLSEEELRKIVSKVIDEYNQENDAENLKDKVLAENPEAKDDPELLNELLLDAAIARTHTLGKEDIDYIVYKLKDFFKDNQTKPTETVNNTNTNQTTSQEHLNFDVPNITRQRSDETQPKQEQTEVTQQNQSEPEAQPKSITQTETTVEAYNTSTNHGVETASQEVRDSAARFHDIKTDNFHFNNERFGTRESVINNLTEIANRTEDIPGEVTAEDAKTLLEMLADKAGSFYQSFKQNLILKLSALNPDCVFDSSLVEFPVQKGSYIETLWTDTNGNVDQSLRNKITYKQAIELVSDPTTRAKLSDREISKLMELFPTMMCMRVSDSGKLAIDEDVVTNMAMNALAIFNSQKDGSGYDWQRIADDLGMDLSSILRVRVRDADGKVIATGADFLSHASAGIMLTPLVRMMNSNVRKSLGLHLNANMSWAMQQYIPSTLTTITVKSLEAMGLIFNEKFQGIGNGITVFSINNKLPNNVANPLTTLKDPAAVNKYLGNDKANDSGDIFIKGKEPALEKSSHDTYENTNIKLTEKGRKARDEYEKVQYRIDEGMASIYESLVNQPNNGLLALYGEDVTDPDNMDPNDLISKKGANLQITKAWEKFVNTRKQMQAIADREGVSLSEVRKRYRLGLTSVNRIQELESFGPIANKLMREVMLSTWNKANLNKKEHMQDLARAIMQNFGAKLNRNKFKKTESAFNALLDNIIAEPTKYSNLMLLVTNPKAVTVDTVNNAHEELANFMKNNDAFKAIKLKSVDKNFMGLHAMQTLAKVVKAKQEGKSEIEVSIYCEADGTTNGTINTQYLMTDNIEEAYAAHLIDLLDKGNMRLGDVSGESAGSAKDGISNEEADVYGASGAKAKSTIAKNLAILKKGTIYPTKKWPKEFINYIKNTRSNDHAAKNIDSVSVDEYIDAVRDVFRYSNLTADANTYLEDEVSRNFMKSPCTKGMYGAGMSSIINTFLYGDRNVPGIINQMYQKRTNVMQAVAKALKANPKITWDEMRPIIARAAFKGVKGAEEWSDNRCITEFENYCRALNILTNVSLKSTADGVWTQPIWAFNNGKNVNNNDGWKNRALFGYASFGHLDQNGKVYNNQASTDLSDENVEAIFNGVKAVYGEAIVQAVNDTIRAENVSGVQNILLQFASKVTFLNNLIALAKIKKFNSDKSTIADGANLATFNDSTIGNLLNLGTCEFQLGWQEQNSRAELTGGNLTNAQFFGRYSYYHKTKPRFNFLDPNMAQLNYGYLENPGVRILPNMAIALGDGDMMGTAMASGFLDAIGYATTLIFDGGNAAVGMMGTYGKLINEIQYNTDMRNILEPVLQKMRNIQEVLMQQLADPTSPYVNLKSLKDIAKTDVGQSIINACKILSFINSNGTEKITTKELEESDALIEALVQVVNPEFNKKTAWDFINKSRENTRGSKEGFIPSVYEDTDFSPLNFSMKNLRAKANKQVFKVVEAALGTERVQKILADAGAAAAYTANIVHPELFKEYIKLFPEGERPKSINEMQLKELHSCLDVVFGNGGIARYTNTKKVLEDYLNSIKQLTKDIAESASDISFLQTAKYCMGGTFDHMASHDSPHVVKPTMEGLSQMLSKFHLKLLNGVTIESLWDQLMENDVSAGQQLIALRDKCTDKNGKFNVQQFLNNENKAARGWILKQFAITLERNCYYDSEFTNPQTSKVNKSKKKTEMTDEEFDKSNKNVSVVPASNFLNKNSKKNSILGHIKDFFSKFSAKFINDTTSIAIVTGETRSKALKYFKQKYKDDVARYNYKVDQKNAEITAYNEAHKDEEGFRPKKLKEHIDSSYVEGRIQDYIDEEEQNRAKPAEQQLDDNAVWRGLQFYDPNLNRVYILPSKVDGMMNKTEEDKLFNERIPHELIHMCVDKAINFMYPSLNDKSLKNKVLQEGEDKTHERTYYAVKALQRLKKLKEQIDALDLAGTNNPTLNNYLREKAKLEEALNNAKDPKEKEAIEAKMLQEFVAYFGTLSDESLNQLAQDIHSASSYTDATGKQRDALDDLTRDTVKDASAFSKIVEAVKSAFVDFISKFLNLRRNDPIIKQILSVNSAIITASYKENWEARLEPSDSLNQVNEKASFLFQHQDPANNTAGSVNIANGSVTNNVNNTTSGLTSLEKLSNSVISAVQQYIANFAKASRYKESAKDSTTLLNRARHNDMRDKLNALWLKQSDPENVMTKIIQPLKNFGLQVGNEKAFCNIINGFTFIKDLKSPLASDLTTNVKHVLDKLSVDNFTNSPNPAMRQQVQNFLNFLQGIGKDSLPANQIAPVILALSQTDTDFRDALSKIKVDSKQNTKGYLVADKFFNKAINNITDEIAKFKGIKPTKNAMEKFDQLVLRMAKDEKIISKTSMLEGAIDAVEGAINAGMTQMARAVSRATGNKFSDPSVIVTRFENLTNTLDWVPKWSKKVIHDLVGATKDNFNFYAANTKVKTIVQQTRENAREKLPILFKQKFKSVSEKQWSQMTKLVGKTGIASLFTGNDTKALSKLLHDSKHLDSEIAKQEQILGDQFRINKCQQLANYMLTGKAGKMLLCNPVAIAKRLGTAQADKSNTTPTTDITACDHLTSLYALKQLSADEKKSLRDLLDNESEGMTNLIMTARHQYKEGIQKAKDNNRGAFNWRKGATPWSYNSKSHFKIAPMSKRKELERLGYKFIREYHGANVDTSTMGVFHSTVADRADFNPGAIQMTAMTANGVNMSTGLSTGPNGGMISGVRNVNTIMNNMGTYTSKNGEDLIPLFDAGGNIYGFERTIDPDLLQDPRYLNPVTDYAELLGIQEGRNVEEALVQEFNNNIVDLVHDQYKSKKNSSDQDYVDLYEVDDPVIKNVVQMLPRNVKEYIKSVYGGDHFYVLRSEVDDVIGYHSASIVDPWTGESNMPAPVQKAMMNFFTFFMGDNAYRYLKTIESTEQDVVKAAKNAIIIRSVVVPAMNMMANAIQLWVEGVPMTTIMKESYRVTKELQQYTALQTQLLEVQQELHGTTSVARMNQLSAQEKFINESIDTLSIAPLLKAGEFSSIVDLGNTARDYDFSKGGIGDRIMEHIDKLSKNELIRSATHYVAVSPDTSMYKFLEKTNQYGDFLGKAILYRDLVYRRGWTPKEANLKIKDEFVDYNRLPGRGRDYLERAGLLWFYNFKLRMAKVAAANLREHPLRSLTLSACGMPTPLTDSIFGKFSVLSYTMGPGMLWSAFTSNPWVALLGLLF